MVVSPDDRHVYVASGGNLDGGTNGVVSFRRDTGTGDLDQSGCVTASSGDGRAGSEGICARGDALLGAADVAISPDGRHAYVAASGSGAVSWLVRDTDSGRLAAAGCVKDVPRGDRCAEVPRLQGAVALAISADGRNVYVAAAGSAALIALSRDPSSGAVSGLQCLSHTGSDGACEPAAGLQRLRDVAVTPDGRWVFAVGGTGAIVTFARDATSGRLRERGCLLAAAPDGGPCRDATGIIGATAIAVSPDSQDVYVASQDSETLTGFRISESGALRQTSCVQNPPSEDEFEEEDREDLSGSCSRATALPWYPSEVTVSADGRSVFVAGGYDTVTSFRRHRSTGIVSDVGCAEGEESDSSCLKVRGTSDLNDIAATTDGRNVYVTTREDTLAILGASVSIESAAARTRRDGRALISLRCPRVRAKACAGGLRLGRGARSRYHLRPGAGARIRVRLDRRSLRVLERRRSVALTVTADDGRRVLSPTTRRVRILRAR